MLHTTLDFTFHAMGIKHGHLRLKGEEKLLYSMKNYLSEPTKHERSAEKPLSSII